jgi:hypothetical protein
MMGELVTPSPELIEAEFGAVSCAFALIEMAMRPAGYDPHAAGRLVAAARGLSGEGWAERKLAVLLLENYLLRTAPAAASEIDALLGSLGVEKGIGILPRLMRLKRAHDAIPGCPDDDGWRYFFRVTRDPAKLTLARYVLPPAEVAAEVRRHLSISRGAASGQCEVDAPAYEAAVLDELCSGRNIFWVSERCGSEINGLVEFPLTSAVVVVKPPGSDYEIEFKRAGTRRARLLDVIKERDGREAPVSHRLFGGSLGWLGDREAASAALFSRIYRQVHRREAPCSQTVMNSPIVTVPCPGGETHILDYLTEGSADTREAMRECVETFPRDTGIGPASYEGERGMTLSFIGQSLPQQAVIFGSSSFRLDRIALYLSNDGAEQYFRDGLGREYTAVEARWLADSVLEEVLGEIETPEADYQDYAQYLRAAFAVPSNRRRADFAYLSVMRQVGECWGTLLGVRGFSDGESFVQRNAGLKCAWQDGGWQVRIIFMDHDDLTMAGSRYRYLWPTRELAGMERDEIHILGGAFGDDPVPGEAGALRAIYRVNAEIAEFGVQALKEATVAAYRKTQEQIDVNAELQALFYPEFVARHRDFDRLIRGFLEKGTGGEEEWKQESGEYLRGRGYDGELVAETVEAITRFRDFLGRMKFLYCRQDGPVEVRS